MILTLLSHPHLHLPTRSLRDSPKCKLVMRNLLSILYSRWLPTFALGNRPQRMQRTTPRRSPHLAVQPDYRGLMLSLQVRCLLQVLGFRRRHHGHQAAHLNCRARPHRHSDRSSMQSPAPHVISQNAATTTLRPTYFAEQPTAGVDGRIRSSASADRDGFLQLHPSGLDFARPDGSPLPQNHAQQDVRLAPARFPY